jgi:hypothetical protein
LKARAKGGKGKGSMEAKEKDNSKECATVVGSTGAQPDSAPREREARKEEDSGEEKG